MLGGLPLFIAELAPDPERPERAPRRPELPPTERPLELPEPLGAFIALPFCLGMAESERRQSRTQAMARPTLAVGGRYTPPGL